MDFTNFYEVYSSHQKNLIKQEFCRLKDECYLDHAGSTLYSEKQIQSVYLDLSKNIYSNPHARNVLSKSTEDAIDIIRYEILDHFNTNNEEYTVIFTSGATAALKLVTESFNYGDDPGAFLYLENNHTSVLGMRAYAKETVEVKTDVAFELLTPNNSSEIHKEKNNAKNSLFVYPAQCNFSGTKYPLKWIESVKNGQLDLLVDSCSNCNWYVVLDCANYVATNSLDLSKYKPDFIPISFYKMFGYPSGLGALLVKKSSEFLLIKKYLGGGTVLMALSSKNVMIPRTALHERFEDGTIPFLSILALKHGFQAIKNMNLNFDIISKHTFSLAQYVYRRLLLMHHNNGKPVVILYHDTVFESSEEQGGIINFNLLRPNGDYIGYAEVLHIANLHGIHLRTGCFCNPGACQRFLKLSTQDVIKSFEAGHVCGDQNDLIDDYPTGSVRISFGYMSTQDDADKFLNMVESCFIERPVVRKLPSNWKYLQEKYKTLFSESKQNKTLERYQQTIPSPSSINNGYHIKNLNRNDHKEDGIGILEQILVYPVKSCGAFKVTKSWDLTSTGLKYDREWMIVNSAGVCLTQKVNKKLCLIIPEIDLKRKTLKLQFKGKSDNVTISLNHSSDNEYSRYLCQSKVCGDRIRGWDCGDTVSEWLSDNLETSGLRLLRQCTNHEMLGRLPKKDTTTQLSLANKAQYLLLNLTSVQWLKQKIPKNDFNEDINSMVYRFRPNFIVNFKEAFQENNFDAFTFDDILFKSAGECTRCQMICINQDTGEISKEPLLTLSREFKGKISFGVYLNQDLTTEDNSITIGSRVTGKKKNDHVLREK